MLVNQKARHLRSNKVGIVVVANSITKKAKIRYNDGSFSNLQSFDNYMIMKKLGEDVEPKPIATPVQDATDEQALKKALVQGRIPYQTILPTFITFADIPDRQKYATEDLSLLPKQELEKRQKLRNLLPADENISTEYWKYVFEFTTHLWGFRPHDTTPVPPAPRPKPTPEKVVQMQCAYAMRDLYYGVGMLGGSAVCYP